jgi:hypothetical protein
MNLSARVRSILLFVVLVGLLVNVSAKNAKHSIIQDVSIPAESLPAPSETAQEETAATLGLAAPTMTREKFIADFRTLIGASKYSEVPSNFRSHEIMNEGSMYELKEEVKKVPKGWNMFYIQFDEYTEQGCTGAINMTRTYIAYQCVQTSTNTSEMYQFYLDGRSYTAVLQMWGNLDCTGDPVSNIDIKGGKGCSENVDVIFPWFLSRPTFAAQYQNFYGNHRHCVLGSPDTYESGLFGWAYMAMFQFEKDIHFNTSQCYARGEYESFSIECVDHKMNETFWTNSVNCSGDPSSSLDVFPPRCETPIFTDMSCQNAPTCFAGSETVTLESGNVVPIDSIRVGDRVLAADASGTLSFADVIAVPHAKNSIVSNVVDLTTASGRSVKMTPDHMILAGSCGGNMKSMRADEVLVGSCVYTVDGSEKIARTSLETSASGLYTIITTEEFVVVNGIVASPYAKSHSAGHALYFVHRMIYTLSPALLMNKVFGAVYHSISSLTMVVSF